MPHESSTRLTSRPVEPVTGDGLEGSFGVIVEGVDVREVDDGTFAELLDLLLAHRFVVLPDQDLSHEKYVAFARRWGRPLRLIQPKSRLEGFPEIIVQHNSEATPEPLRDRASHWHCDSSYEAEVSTFTMLYGVETPERGGVTRFADLVGTYEALPAGDRARYDQMAVRHATSAATPLEDETIVRPQTLPEEYARDVELPDPVTHPLVATHPVNGRKALYGLGGSSYGIEELSEQAGGDLLLDLRRHATAPRFCAGYRLMPRDVLIWDNFSVMHRATPARYSDAAGERRLNYRISVKGVPGEGVDAAGASA